MKLQIILFFLIAFQAHGSPLSKVCSNQTEVYNFFISEQRNPRLNNRYYVFTHEVQYEHNLFLHLNNQDCLFYADNYKDIYIKSDDNYYKINNIRLFHNSTTSVSSYTTTHSTSPDTTSASPYTTSASPYTTSASPYTTTTSASPHTTPISDTLITENNSDLPLTIFLSLIVLVMVSLLLIVIFVKRKKQIANRVGTEEMSVVVEPHYSYMNRIEHNNLSRRTFSESSFKDEEFLHY